MKSSKIRMKKADLSKPLPVPAPSAERKEIILFAVTGMSPAILTETVWALAHEIPSVVPDRVVVVTTLAGRAGIVRELLEPRPAIKHTCLWDDLMAALEKQKINTRHKLRFGATGSDIRVFAALDPKTGRTRELEDIRTKKENEAAADFLLETLRGFTENVDCQVVASMAGGRKTMGALLYACVSLIGRETDRLTHVLVDEPFDDPRLEPRFYFPAQRDSKLRRVDGKIFDSRKAEISLADVPYVPLRNLFERDLTRRPGSFARLVEEASQKLSTVPPGEMVVGIDQPQITVDGLTLRFAPREHVLIIQLARDCLEGRPAYPDHPRAHAAYEKTAMALREQVSDAFHDWRSDIPKTTNSDDIRKIISSIRSKLKKAGGGAARLERFLDSSRGVALHLSPSTVILGR